jgi:hypothetical protein
MINPKLINIERCRVGTDDDIKSVDLVDFRGCGDKMNLSASGLKRETLKDGRIYIPNENGRFPTQLFTNLTDEKYKYIKYVDTKN